MSEDTAVNEGIAYDDVFDDVWVEVDKNHPPYLVSGEELRTELIGVACLQAFADLPDDEVARMLGVSVAFVRFSREASGMEVAF